MLIRTDPFREFDRLMQQFVGTVSRPAAMPMDAYRDGDRFVVEFDLPGVSADSIDLTVEKNVLTVHASRQRHALDGAEFIVSERSMGDFSRQLFLSESLDTDNIEASYTDGVLKVQIPVAEKARPRKVAINSDHTAPAAIEADSREAAPVGA